MKRILLCGLTLLLPVLAGCKKANQYQPPPPPKVTIARPLAAPITRYLESTGNTTPYASVDLVARVEGFIQGISYTDGADVKVGDVLFTIEPLPYQMKLQQAQAAEAAAQATLVQTQATFVRQDTLQRSAVASVQALDDARAARDNAQANVQQAQATTQIAAINYAYTRVLAPFDGRVSAHLVSLGDLVGVSPTKLATIVQIKPIYVNFAVSEQDVLRVRAARGGKPLSLEELGTIPVEIGLQGEAGYPHRGRLNYAAPTLDPATGTIAVRGILDNGDEALLPGMFARIRVPLETDVPALLVPDTALGSDQGGSYLLVVAPDHTVTEKRVKTGPLDGALRVIESGLAAEDMVVIDGLQRAVPGQAVDPVAVSVKRGSL